MSETHTDYPDEFSVRDRESRGAARMLGGLLFVLLVAGAFVAFCFVARAAMAHDYYDRPGWNRSAAPLERGDEERPRFLLVYRITNDCSPSGITLTPGWGPGSTDGGVECPATRLVFDVFESLADVMAVLNSSPFSGVKSTYFTPNSFAVLRLDDLTEVKLSLREWTTPEKREVVTRERRESEWVKP